MRTRAHWQPLFTRSLLVALLLTLVVVAGLPVHTQAVEITPAASPAFLQTSGPLTFLGTGDFYTSSAGANDPQGHTIEILVPCGWPSATPVTFALFDPEVNTPNQTAAPPIVDDEIRDAGNNEVTNPITVSLNADNTRFTLFAPGGTTLGPITFTPAGGTNLRWVELATFTPGTAGYGCGTYIVRTTTGDGTAVTQFNNDDNAWRLRVVNDPDCTVSPGTCSGIGAIQSGLLGNTNGTDDIDAVAGTGDELIIGLVQASFQHQLSNAQTSCQDFYEFVDGNITPVLFHNFDMDENTDNATNRINITYFPPSSSNYAPSQVGVTSVDSDWNPPPKGGTPPVRGGDSFVIDADDIGWWRIRVCVNNDNQYIFEGQQGIPVYFTQPPTPRMVLSKTDNQSTFVAIGQPLTYTLTFTNTSNVAPPTPPVPGAAQNVIITDTLPLNLNYVGCSVTLPLVGTCSHTGPTPGGAVTFLLSSIIKAGQVGQVRIFTTVNSIDGTDIVNDAVLRYKDPLKNNFPPVRGTDRTPTAVTLASFAARPLGAGVRVQWLTGSEVKTLGFHLLRATSPDVADAVRVTTELIPARGVGSSYGWTDQNVVAGTTYYYWLEETETTGAINNYGPVSTTTSPLNADYMLFLPLMLR